jgi:hypothetical protein
MFCETGAHSTDLSQAKLRIATRIIRILSTSSLGAWR